MTIIKGMLGSAALLAALSVPLQAAEPVKVGSKIDTEGALLGNIILQVLESHGLKTVNKVQRTGYLPGIHRQRGILL